MQIESFFTPPLQQIIPSYLFKEYSDDENLQAFVDSYNSISQGYLEWFNDTPLGLYVSPYIQGTLLDWVGNGIYGISRPVLSDQTSYLTAGYNASAYNTIPYAGEALFTSGNAVLATDDIYKRVLTWDLYRGDGQVFTMGWLKNRINRFINGLNGSDYAVQNNPPDITISGNTFTLTLFSDVISLSLQTLITNNSIQLPFQYDFEFINVTFSNDGGVLQMSSPLDYPTSPSGLVAGDIWYNGGTVAVIPGGTFVGAPVFFGAVTAASLLALGGAGLPTTDPVNLNQLWNNGGLISISA